MVAAMGRKSYQHLWLGVPLYWMFLSVSRGVFFWRANTVLETNIDYLAGSPIERAALICLMVLGILILLGRKKSSNNLFS